MNNGRQRQRSGNFLVILLASAVLCGFIFEKHIDNFFPMEEGRKFEYSYTRAKDNAIIEKAAVTVTNNPKRTWEQKTVMPRTYEKLNDKKEKQVHTVFFHNDGEGIMMVAFQGEKDGQPKALPHKLAYLRSPLKVGNRWGGGDDPQGVIDSLSDKVAVPAGTFDGCIKVKLTYPSNLPVQEAFLWFAENVGVVKSLHRYRDGSREEFELKAVK